MKGPSMYKGQVAYCDEVYSKVTTQAAVWIEGRPERPVETSKCLGLQM